ncbi:MAG: NADH-quinone oxidoreductase subunit H [Phycisphaerae bacterium]|nr:NADH-quinone oxidoreductase subunit H [Phycisphaerae bacterium]
MSDAIQFIQLHVPPWFYIAVIMHLAVLGSVAYLILLERKIASWAQDRIGPNRVGLGFGIIPWLKDKHMFGLGQPLADGLKFILKEDYRPKGVDKILFTLAPGIMITVVIISIAVIPWGGTKQGTIKLDIPTSATDPAAAAAAMLPSDYTVVGTPVPMQRGNGTVVYNVTYRYPFQIADLNVGVLYVLAVLSLAVYGVVIGGWASNNKYSFLGGLRATANMISYEVPLGLCVLCIILMFGTLDMGKIIEMQTHRWIGIIPAWNVFTQPLAFAMFLVCIHAEANRAPFDTAEAEQELVGGYHTEYSAMRFALFFLGEYAGMITTSCVCIALFFGGWDIPYLTDGHIAGADRTVTGSLILCILRTIIFFSKAMIVMAVFMWVRWSLPRFRFDQIMQLAWRGMIPISLLLVMATTLAVYLTGGYTKDGVTLEHELIFLVMNLAIVVLIAIAYKVLPAPPDTNRKIVIPGSRFNRTPLPAT